MDRLFIWNWALFSVGILKGPGWWLPLIFPKVPQSSLGILRVPQLPPPLEHPPLKNSTSLFHGHEGWWATTVIVHLARCLVFSWEDKQFWAMCAGAGKNSSGRHQPPEVYLATRVQQKSLQKEAADLTIKSCMLEEKKRSTQEVVFMMFHILNR